MRWSSLLLFAALTCLPSLGSAQRVALLFGNTAYEVGRLTNPRNDVREMEVALVALGFKVQKLLDGDQKQMRRALRDFGDSARSAEFALLYYSGHGVQVNGENFLIPLGTHIEKESDYEIEAVRATDLLTQIDRAKPKAALVVLDACRDNPYARATKSEVKGLARMQAPQSSSAIAFSTAPNQTAGDEGYYARVLAKQLRKPGQELFNVFRTTGLEVTRLTSGKQNPRVSEWSIHEEIYLAGSAAPPPGNRTDSSASSAPLTNTNGQVPVANSTPATVVPSAGDWFQVVSDGKLQIAEQMLARNVVGPGTFIDKEGNIAIHLAAERCNAEMVRMLITHGSPLSLKNVHKETPLHIANWRCGSNDNTTKVLRNAGAQ